MPNSRLIIYAASSHMSVVEKSAQAMVDIGAFLAEQVIVIDCKGTPFGRFNRVHAGCSGIDADCAVCCTHMTAIPVSSQRLHTV